MDSNNNQSQQLSIDIKPDVAKGQYSNLAIISHSRSEFIIDFATMLPGIQKPEVNSRIIMTPEHAQRLLNALADNIQKYESQFGRIQTMSKDGNTINLNDFINSGTGKKS